MRLSKPSFQVSNPLSTEKEDITGMVFTEDIASPELPFGVSEMLTLPHSFG